MPAPDALFDADPFLVEPGQSEPLSADRRRTLRQRNDIALGRHPLAGAPIHEQAPKDAAPGGEWRPFTCGTCSHRLIRHTGVKAYPKCDIGPVTHGAGTDVRAWWPACTSYDDTPRSEA